jgi:hypothetical protein
MEPVPPAGRSGHVKLVAVLVCVAAIAVPAAYGKGSLVVRMSDRTPAVGQRFSVDVRTGYVVPENDWLRLIAVAPGKKWFDVVGTVTGDSSKARATIPREGFEITLTRVGARHWRALVRLPRAGRWRLVVPNGTHVGFMVPPPAAWMPWVQVHR